MHHVLDYQSFARSATSFIEDNIILCPLKRNDVDRIRSNSVLAFARNDVVSPRGHKHKKDILTMSFLMARFEG